MDSLSNVALIFDIDGVIRDVAGSYRRALADTVEHFTAGSYRPTPEDIDLLKSEGIWNNDWEGAQELIQRYRSGKIAANHLDRTGAEANEDNLDPAAPKMHPEMPKYGQIVLFFQQRYMGQNPEDVANWTGYVTEEPLIANPDYFRSLDTVNIAWGFFSGATRSSANYVLSRLDIKNPVLVAMEDVPGKPDPTGLITVSAKLGDRPTVIYAGDTAADMLTVVKAKETKPDCNWLGVGILPPHVNARPEAKRLDYAQMLRSNGADLVLPSILELTPAAIANQIAAS
ncbi:HAD superfamily (subfamily IA) hydrolase, TIGR01548 [Thalassoporum mexicanum PCC 7367]|uniref:TIGR01548 family HAD-type hydrolase n=1 Tax=Thalassoporum mexicanum TaxID=3457544 RepID=UPI00029FF7D4|nr:TIGR01548 family HAD-type hydrolase [Pseudanabaena sp. PCC 7367]AFY71567.1 HAD superfamily (subfamily IA) hydrolase, TIGR01548 [Pseudanabaena sp. PCC 7367]